MDARSTHVWGMQEEAAPWKLLELDPGACDPSSLAGTPIFCLFSMIHFSMKEDSGLKAEIDQARNCGLLGDIYGKSDGIN